MLQHELLCFSYIERHTFYYFITGNSVYVHRIENDGRNLSAVL